MSRPRKPARLWQDNQQRWVILDGTDFIRTGHRGESGRTAAEKCLSDYISTKLPVRSGPASPADCTVGEVFHWYATEHAKTVQNPASIAYSIKAMSPYWGDLPVSEVKGSTCRGYSKWRMKPYKAENGRVYSVSPGTIRKDLGCLQAALNYAHQEGKILYAPKVSLVHQSGVRDRWLTRPEADLLLAACAPHVARFTLIALATGSRSSAILGLRWGPSIQSGWVDTELGIIHRKGASEKDTKKRRGSVKVPEWLLVHLREWEKHGGSHVVQWGSGQVHNIRSGFTAACVRAGLEDVTPHTLKHTAVTWFFQAGGTIEDASDYFDTTPATLLRVYRQHSPLHQQRATAIMQTAQIEVSLQQSLQITGKKPRMRLISKGNQDPA